MEFNLEKDLLEEINEEEIEANLSGGTFTGGTFTYNKDTTGLSLCTRCNFTITITSNFTTSIG